jgi:hypothetical protein
VNEKYTKLIMTQTYYSIVFDYDGIHYNGLVTPEVKAHQDKPSSYHVVLNEVFFGYVSRNKNQWQVSEQRPDGLVQKVGKQIEQTSHQYHTT